MNKPIAYFDLDGTLRDTYRFRYPRAHQITLFHGITERLTALRAAGYYLVGMTNQGGVSLKQVTRADVELANHRTQELLGDARLDLLLYCPHHIDGGGPECDCKKPAPGMLLDALAALPEATLDGAFVVGDDLVKDKGAADTLALPFVDASIFRQQSVDATLRLVHREKQRASSPEEDRVAGSLVGMAVGDAFAAPVEFWDRSTVRKKYPNGLEKMRSSELWEAGEYTDDTQMALLLANSLLSEKTLNVLELAGRFRHWAKTSKDVGNQIRRVLQRPGYEANPEASAREDYWANPGNAAGNGAVMRCAPVALFRNDSLSMLLADSRRSARMTHGDPKAQSSCVLINLAIRHLLNGGKKEGAWKHGMKYLTPYETLCWHRLDLLPTLGDDQIQSGGYTVSTVEAAFWCFEKTASFAEAIELAASLGDDADTVAAVTGALAGAYYGFDWIPKIWLNCLKDEQALRLIAGQLIAA